MKYYIKQKVLTLVDHFGIFDENGTQIYDVVGKVFSLGKQLRVNDINGNEVAFVRQKLFTFLHPTYFLSQNGREYETVIRNITFFRPKFTLQNLGWTVQGNILAHDYVFTGPDGSRIAAVAKRWFSWGDTYEIDICPGVDEMTVLLTVLAIDSIRENTAASVSASSNSD